MRDKARALVATYVRDYSEDLLRTWATERPFELYLPGWSSPGAPMSSTTTTTGSPTTWPSSTTRRSPGNQSSRSSCRCTQTRDDAKGSTLGGAFIHDMSTARRHDVDVADEDIAAAENTVLEKSSD